MHVSLQTFPGLPGMSNTQTRLSGCAALVKCPHHQEANPGTIRTQAMLSFTTHAVVQYALKHCCLLLHMQSCKPAHYYQPESYRSQPALTLVVKERSSLAFTGEVHVKLSYVCMKTPAGSVTVCPPLSPELPSTELTKHKAPSKFGWRAR